MAKFLTKSCIFSFVATLLFIVNSCSKHTDEDPLVITPTINPPPYTVMVYLITPPDKKFNPVFYRAAKSTLLSLQTWYKNQLANNKTFMLNPVVVDTLTGIHNSSWFGVNNGPSISGDGSIPGYYNTKYEMQQLLGAGFDTVHYDYFVYVDADFPDQTKPRGLAAEGLPNLEGLSSSTPGSWIGGSGHSLGHSFGLPEVAVENSDGIMSAGFPKYPNCDLKPPEKDSLNASPFFQVR